jgi:hypothetical protein
VRALLGRLARAFGADRAAAGAAVTATVHGLAVSVYNTRPDVDTADVLARLDAAFGLIARYTPHYWRHLRRDFTGVVVRREAFRGAYFPDTGLCLVELTFVVNRAFTPAQVAATVLHEGDARAAAPARLPPRLRRPAAAGAVLPARGGPVRAGGARGASRSSSAR